MAQILGGSVRVTASILPAGSLRRDFGRTLYLTKITVAVTGRELAQLIRSVSAFSSDSSVDSTDYPDDVKDASSIYFQQSPYPKNLMIATQCTVAQLARINGAVGRSITDISALGDNVTLSVDGNDFMVDLDGTASFADQASALQAGIQTVSDFSAATVTHDGEGFVIENATGFGSGILNSSASRTLGLSTASGAVILAPIPVETVAEALTRAEGIDCTFYWVAFAPAIALVDSDILEGAAWIAPKAYQTVVDLYGAGVLVQNETASVGAQLYALSQNNVGGFYNGLEIDQKALSYMARFSSVNFSQPNALITGKFKILPGTVAPELSETERAELDRKRINYYAPVTQTESETAQGVTFGTWTDVKYWLDWFQNALSVEARGALVRSGKLPQTDAGVDVLGEACENVCAEGVRNGGLAPNNVTPSTRLDIQQSTGNLDFDGFLSNGWLVYRGRIADQPQSSREARQSPPIKIWGKSSGAIHFVDITAVLEN